MVSFPRSTRALMLAVLVSGAGLRAADRPDAGADASGAVPRSFDGGVASRLPAPAVFTLPPVDVATLVQEDTLVEQLPEVLPRAGFPMKTDLDTDRAGTWDDLPSGDRIWRLLVRSPRARWIVLGFGTWRLQPGASLWVFAGQPGMGPVMGPFTSDDVREHGQLWLPPFEGDAVVLELDWPASLTGEVPNFHLGTVSHGYRSWGGIGRDKDGLEPEAGSCNIDVNCPLGNDWQDEKRGVVNLLTGGSGYCSGSLIATTAQDCKRYVLTAGHCVSSSSKAASTVFQFNFERPACNSGIPPTGQTTSGSTLRATYSASDFTLLEMDVEPPEGFGAHFNGWSRSTSPSPAAYVIHHPNNDEKKISYNDDSLFDGSNWGPNHWRVNDYEQGTTEPGSSGSPLFDVSHRIVGQLHGGPASCTTISYDEYGKVDASWIGGGSAVSRLRDWLDPGNTGATVQDGVDATFCAIPKPRLAYQSHVVDDAQGNGDGVADPGETFVLRLDAKNVGTLGATQVTGTLSSATPAVTLVDDTADYGTIPSASTRTSQAPHYTVQLDASHACGSVLAFHLDLTAAEDPGQWASDFEVGTGTASVSTTFEDLMEAGDNGFTQIAIQGANPWSLTTADSSSPTHSWFVADPGTRHDTALLLPPMANLPARSRLTFRHRYNTENNYDGGVLEYGTDGVAWTDAASLITSGGYSGSINTGAATNLAGRGAWAGDSAGWRTVEADLGTLAGATLHLRWRFATDTSVSDEGWYVDDVRIQSTSYTCSAPLARPGEAADPAAGGAPFTVDKDPGGYRLDWSAPVSGGAVATYGLYRTALAATVDPICEADLGSGLSIVLPDLTSDRGFLVVARNAAGEGSYGQDSAGTEHSQASGGNACP